MVKRYIQNYPSTRLVIMIMKPKSLHNHVHDQTHGDLTEEVTSMLEETNFALQSCSIVFASSLSLSRSCL